MSVNVPARSRLRQYVFDHALDLPKMYGFFADRSVSLLASELRESYLQVMFGFLGVTDICIVRAEGLAIGDAVRAEAMRAESAEINALNVVSADESLVS